MEHSMGEIAKIYTTDRTFKDGYLSSQLSIQRITKYAGTKKQGERIVLHMEYSLREIAKIEPKRKL